MPTTMNLRRWPLVWPRGSRVRSSPDLHCHASEVAPIRERLPRTSWDASLRQACELFSWAHWAAKVVQRREAAR
eukprot:5127704-Prymnesium_polylepis.1